MKYIYLILLLLSCENSFSQSKIILEACNKIENSKIRLDCFNEAIKIKSEPQLSNQIDQEKIAIDKTQKAFFMLQEVIKRGTSLNNYNILIIDIAKEVGSLKLTLKGEMPYMIGILDDAIIAYNDAAILWHTSIYESQDGGILVGKILNPDRTGLSKMVVKYKLPTETKLFNKHIPFEIAIQKIWDHAENLTREAFKE